MLRGLLYLYEITGESRFKDRAEVVYTVIARAQNEDGSWHKRFQVLDAGQAAEPGTLRHGDRRDDVGGGDGNCSTFH